MTDDIPMIPKDPIEAFKAGREKGIDEAYDDYSTRPLTDAQIRQLVNNLNPERVATRSQGGTSLSYLEAWDVRASLIRIFGFGNWSADLVEPVKVLRIDEVEVGRDKKPGFRALALATVRLRIHQTGATYTESGAASQQGPDIGEVTDFAVKTAESDALKRAAVNLGTQFGLSLYDDGSRTDVIKVILAPGQQETLKRVREAQEAKRAGVSAPAPGEDPRDDLPPGEQPMALTEPPRADAKARMSRAFDRQALIEQDLINDSRLY